MGEADPDELEKLLEEVGVIQDALTNNDFYIIDSKVEKLQEVLG